MGLSINLTCLFYECNQHLNISHVRADHPIACKLSNIIVTMPSAKAAAC